MEAHDKKTRGSQSDDTDSNELQEKMAELNEIREELYRAKDSATQSWLDSKPLIDELEKQQAGLASAKNRISMSNMVISELGSQIETISREIKSKMEDESKAKETINELNWGLEQKYKESDAIKLEADEELRAKTKLKQVLRIRKQTLKTLQLMLQAVRIESEASEASAADSIGHINNSGTNTTVVTIRRVEYYELRRRAKEETAIARSRVSVSMEQQFAAEESRVFALSRLKELRRRQRKDQEKINEDEYISEEAEEGQSSELQANRGAPFPKARAEVISKSEQWKSPRRSGRKSKKKKPSILSRIRNFLVRRIARFLR